MEWEVVALRQRPELLQETAELLNSEWPRSLSARLASLEEGEASLPSSLVLLHVCPQSGGVHVAGHVRLIAAAGTAMAVLVEALLVSRELRGQGHGGRLMRAAEEHAACLNCRTVHLSTHDRQGFYHHLGYREGPPTTGLRRCVARLSSEQAQSVLCEAPSPALSPAPLLTPSQPSSISLSPSASFSSPSPPPIPPPPPPPLPQSALLVAHAVTWLQKTLIV